MRMMAGSVAVVLMCAASLLAWNGPERAVRISGESRLVLATVSVPDGFSLSFIHSINLSPVDEDFSIDSGAYVRLDRVRFDQLSTGMPSGDEDGFEYADGRFTTRPGKLLAEISARVSPVPGHSFTANGRTRPLTCWAPAGGLLTFRAARPRAPERR